MSNKSSTNLPVPTKKLYTFTWKGGGYNQVYATSVKEARQIVDKEFPTMGGSKSIVNLKALGPRAAKAYWDNFPIFDYPVSTHPARLTPAAEARWFFYQQEKTHEDLALLTEDAQVLYDLWTQNQVAEPNSLEALQGLVLLDVNLVRVGDNCDDKIVFVTSMGVMQMYHQHDCSESVSIEGVVGDPMDLIGALVVLAETAVSQAGGEATPEIENRTEGTWTFYKLRTTKGDVTIRWWGTSNGYYSEEVSCIWHETATAESVKHAQTILDSLR